MNSDKLWSGVYILIHGVMDSPSWWVLRLYSHYFAFFVHRTTSSQKPLGYRLLICFAIQEQIGIMEDSAGLVQLVLILVQQQLVFIHHFILLQLL